MPHRDKPWFLARQSYRKRRVIDAARVLPIFGTVFFLLPILWDVGGTGAADPDAQPHLAQRGLYLFAVWGGLVICAAIIAAQLRPDAGPETEPMAGPISGQDTSMSQPRVSGAFAEPDTGRRDTATAIARAADTPVER